MTQNQKYNSKILLLNDSQSSLAAKIDDQNSTQGVVVGERGLTIKLELISKDNSIIPGMLVTTSGLEEAVTAGLVVGTIERLQQQDNSFVQTAIIKPIENYSNLVAVSVLIPKFND